VQLEALQQLHREHPVSVEVEEEEEVGPQEDRVVPADSRKWFIGPSQPWEQLQRMVVQVEEVQPAEPEEQGELQKPQPLLVQVEGLEAPVPVEPEELPEQSAVRVQQVEQELMPGQGVVVEEEATPSDAAVEPEAQERLEEREPQE